MIALFYLPALALVYFTSAAAFGGVAVLSAAALADRRR